MAKTKVEQNIIDVNSWEEADVALKEIAIAQSKIQSENALYNEDEQKERGKLEKKLTPLRTKVEGYEAGLQKFCEDHRNEFLDKKSKELTHGLVAFRLSTPSIKTKKGWTLGSVLLFIKSSAAWASRFIRTKEELDKEALLACVAAREVTEDQLAQIGLLRHQDESFYYQPKLAAE